MVAKIAMVFCGMYQDFVGIKFRFYGHTTHITHNFMGYIIHIYIKVDFVITGSCNFIIFISGSYVLWFLLARAQISAKKIGEDERPLTSLFFQAAARCQDSVM